MKTSKTAQTAEDSIARTLARADALTFIELPLTGAYFQAATSLICSYGAMKSAKAQAAQAEHAKREKLT